MRGIIDCNNFYCSCERLFRPELKNQPVVVLSNNDGCIISLSDEAKKLGIKMGTPYFMAKHVIHQHSVSAFSSNYNLYGDLSRRVMDTVKTILPAHCVEVYSVDEAFLDLSHIPFHQLAETAQHIRQRVEQWTGISVSIGIAPTKTLAKVANRLAKKDKAASNCIMVLQNEDEVMAALQNTAVGDVWGVGGRSVVKLEAIGIRDAWQFRHLPVEWVRKNLGGVVGVRLINELLGQPSISMFDQLEEKKMISTTRMFGCQVTELKHMQEAVATYVTRAAEKLRRQNSAARELTVFVVPYQPIQNTRYKHGPTQSAYQLLPVATSNTMELIKPAMQMVKDLYQQGQKYKKAGVILGNLEPFGSIQSNFFADAGEPKRDRLMKALDNLNFSMRNDKVRFASTGLTRNWKMRQDLHSPHYTSRWEEVQSIC